MTAEREEFKKFQDKSVEYQKQREDKINELEAKITELMRNTDKDIEIPLESVEISKDIGIGTSQSSIV